METEWGKSKKGFLLGQKLRQLREENKLSRKQLADTTGISPATITRLESGSFVTTTDTLVTLAGFFNVSYGYLLGESVDFAKRGVASDKVKEKLAALVDKIMSLPGDTSGLIDHLSILVESFSGEKSVNVNIEGEEEILGLWWTIVHGYSTGNWNLMIIQSEELVKLASTLNRPNLVALGFAYKAKAIRNMGEKDALENARRELSKISEDSINQSALLLRLSAKIDSREKMTEKALEKCVKALQRINNSKRCDALFLLEKTKLFRNLATYHRRLAVASDDKSSEKFEEHKKMAYECLDSAGRTIESLKKYLRDEAIVEEMLLAYNFALYYEAVGENKQARDFAIKSLTLAVEREDYAIKIKMFLLHINVKLEDMDKAVFYYGTLFPMTKCKKGWFKHHYDELVKPHEQKLLGYLGLKVAGQDNYRKN